MTRAALENAIRSPIAARAAITTIWAHQTTATGAAIPRPSTPHLLLGIVSDEADGLPSGRGDAVLSGGSYLQQLTEDRYTRCSIRAFGAGALDILDDLRLYLQTDTARAAAMAAGIGLANVGGITDLTALDRAGWEQVASMDTVWHRRQSLSVDEGVLESLTIPLTFNEGSTTITQTVSIDATP